MNSISELDWRQDLRPMLQYCRQTVAAKPIMFGAVLTMSLIEALSPGASGPAAFVQSILDCFLGFAMIQQVFQDKVKAEAGMTQPKTPWIRLMLLETIYGPMVFFLSLFLLIPGIWWGICSSLAYVLICVENSTINASIVKSHQLISRHFGLAVKYLLPINLLIVLPTLALNGGAGYWCDFVHKQSDISLLLLVSISAAAIITTAIALLAWLTSLGLLVRLYVYVKEVSTSAS
jgi:hypothetical protein